MRAGPGASATRRARNSSRAAAGALHLDEHTLAVVPHVARQAESSRQTVDVGPEPDPLDETGHAESEADRRPLRDQVGHAPGPLRRPSVTAASRCIRPKL